MFTRLFLRTLILILGVGVSQSAIQSLEECTTNVTFDPLSDDFVVVRSIRNNDTDAEQSILSFCNTFFIHDTSGCSVLRTAHLEKCNEAYASSMHGPTLLLLTHTATFFSPFAKSETATVIATATIGDNSTAGDRAQDNTADRSTHDNEYMYGYVFQKKVFESLDDAISRGCSSHALHGQMCTTFRDMYLSLLSPNMTKNEYEIFANGDNFLAFPIHKRGGGGVSEGSSSSPAVMSDEDLVNHPRAIVYLFGDMRVVDAVDDLFSQGGLVVDGQTGVPIENSLSAEAILSVLCGGSYVSCDELPPRRILGYLMLSILEKNKKSIWYRRYLIREGYSLAFHINSICALTSCELSRDREYILQLVEVELENAATVTAARCSRRSSSASPTTTATTATTISSIVAPPPPAAAAAAAVAASSVVEVYSQENSIPSVITREPICEKEEEVGISLGYNCNTAEIAVQAKVRKRKKDGYRTGPFDLLISNYDGVVQCILDDFKYFTDPNYLKVSVLKESYPNLNLQEGHGVIVNTKYNFIFQHETDLDKALQWEGGAIHFIENNFMRFIERYDKRIDNFRSYMKSGKRIHFLHKTGTMQVSQTLGFPRFRAAMRLQYPNTTYRITPLVSTEGHEAYGYVVYHSLMNVSIPIVY